MKKVYLYLLALVLITSFTQCSKEGGAGPEGSQGEQGPAGPAGPAGADGSVIYSGTGTPDGKVGKSGDYYLDTKTGSLYGPKKGTAWGSATIVLMGQDGTNGEDGKDGTNGRAGTDGNTIYSGSLALQTSKFVPKPSLKIGKVGDFFLDKTNYNLFGPKTSTSWGLPINLQGADGKDGKDGVDGKDGKDGVDGQDGNANVTQYVFGEFQTTMSSTLLALNISNRIVDNSLISVYVRRASTWIAVPGKEFTQVLINGYPDHTNVWLAGAEKPVGFTYDGARIIVTRVSSSITMNNALEKPDMTNYEAVCDYYGLLH